MKPATYAIKGELRGQALLLIWLAPIVCLGMVAAALASPPTGTNRTIFAVLFAVFLSCIPFGLWYRSLTSATIEVDDASLTFRRGSKVTRIRWSDVCALENRQVSRRLKVFSVTGAVINVEHQFAGFEELAAIIAARSGRSIEHLSQEAPAIAEGDVEIAPPQWFGLLIVVFVPVAAYFFCVNPVIQAWRRHSATPLIAAVIGGWLVIRATRDWWFRLAMDLRMDQSGIHFRTRKELVSALWGDISTAQLEHPNGDTWFIVRDRKGEPLIALRREFFNWTGSAMKRFDQLAATAQHRTRLTQQARNPRTVPTSAPGETAPGPAAAP